MSCAPKAPLSMRRHNIVPVILTSRAGTSSTCRGAIRSCNSRCNSQHETANTCSISPRFSHTWVGFPSPLSDKEEGDNGSPLSRVPLGVTGSMPSVMEVRLTVVSSSPYFLTPPPPSSALAPRPSSAWTSQRIACRPLLLIGPQFNC